MTIDPFIIGTVAGTTITGIFAVLVALIRRARNNANGNRAATQKDLEDLKAWIAMMVANALHEHRESCPISVKVENGMKNLQDHMDDLMHYHLTYFHTTAGGSDDN